MSLNIDTVSDSDSWFWARRFGSSCRAKPTPFGNMVMPPRSDIVGSVGCSLTVPPCGGREMVAEPWICPNELWVSGVDCNFLSKLTDEHSKMLRLTSAL